MFKKVLIAEDYESTSISVQRSLQDLGIEEAKYVYYCDYALTWMQNALMKDQPYELLITDLSFEEDYNKQKIANGIELISAIKKEQPTLKVIVFSIESRPTVIEPLFSNLAINGYVRKARNDAQTLKQAIIDVYNGKRYISSDLKHAIKEKNVYEFTAFDIKIISLLAQGVYQKEIPVYLQRDNIKPSGLSSVEKRLNFMREEFGFSKNEQLIAYCKDIGII